MFKTMYLDVLEPERKALVIEANFDILAPLYLIKSLSAEQINCHMAFYDMFKIL